MNYKLVAFDLDGTVLDSNKYVSKKNRSAIWNLGKFNYTIVAATGRLYEGIPEPLRKIPFLRYCICANGAYIYDTALKRTISRAEVPLESALKFYEYMDTLDVLYDCYQGNTGYMTKDMYDRAEEYVPEKGILQLVKTMRNPVPELKQYLREKGEDIQKLQAYFKDTELRDRQLELLPKMFPELLFTTSVKNNIEVNSKYASKGSALATLCDYLDIDISETVAFGDSLNDMDMIRRAGLSIAMRNAQDEIKEAADIVTLSNDEDGVADAIYKYLLKKDKKGHYHRIDDTNPLAIYKRK